MTLIRIGRFVDRQTCALWRGRELMVRLDTHMLQIKTKGQRWGSAYTVPYRSIYDLGAKIKARENRAARRNGNRRRLSHF
jgi:hypothetical protein